jgi:hypothetical protein
MAARRPINVNQATRNIRAEIANLGRSVQQSNINKREFMRTIYKVLEDIYDDIIENLPDCEDGRDFVDRVAKPVQQIDPALYGEIMRALRFATQNNIDSYKFDRTELGDLQQKLRQILEKKIAKLRLTTDPAVRSVVEPRIRSRFDSRRVRDDDDGSVTSSLQSIWNGFFGPKSKRIRSSDSRSSDPTDYYSDTSSLTDSDDESITDSQHARNVDRARHLGGWRIKSRKSRDTRKTNKSRQKLKNRSRNKRKTKTKRNSKVQLTL